MNTKKIVKFGDICQEVKLTTKDPISDGFEYYIGLEHLDSNSLTIKRWGIIRDDNPSFTRVFKKGHILFGKRRSYLKKAAIAKFDGICSSDIIVMEPIGDIVLHELVPYIIQSEPFWDFAIRTSSGSLSPRTKWKDLATYTFNISEQQGQLLKLFQTMEKTLVASNNLLDACQQKKKILIRNLMTGKIRLFDNIGNKFCDQWKNFSFGKLFNIVIGGTPARSKPEYWDSKKITENRWLSIANLQSSKIYDSTEYISDLGVKNSNVTLIPAGTIVMSFKLTIGKKAYLMKDFYTNEAICALIIKRSELLDQDYLFYALETINFDTETGQAVKGKTLNKKKLNNLQLKLPDINEQKKIVSLLLQADEEIAIIQNKIKSLENIKRNILLTSFNK